jgi:C4-dicarboxylate-specific signal transduction histidine kinase
MGMLGTTQDITERRLAEEELAKMHKNLLEVSRRAGMAEVATGVLHNVGNVLNSVNVSAMLISDRLSKSRVAHLSNVSATLKENAADLGRFLTSNPKGRKLPGFIESLAERLTAEQKEVLTEVEGLAKNIAHIKEIVAMQQNYAKISGVIEPLHAAELVEDALELNSAAFERHKIEVIRDFAKVPRVMVDKHKVLQILINVVRNAKYAVSETSRRGKKVIVRVTGHGHNSQQRVQISVTDNGVGIAPENLARIFAHGFTTKRDGHGFGLHSAALAAKEMGGSLVAQSDGPDKGATFTLELPIDPHAEV